MAIIDSGYGKAYETPFLAAIAANSNDTIRVFPSALNGCISMYYGTFGTITKNLTFLGMGQCGLYFSARQYIGATVNFENLEIYAPFNNDYGLWIQAGNTFTANKCIFYSLQSNRPIFPYQSGSIANIYNSLFIGVSGLCYHIWVFGGTANVYNCTFVNSNQTTNSGFRVESGTTANVANCLFSSGVPVIQNDGGTLNADYNAWNIAPLSGNLGSNNLIKTITELGLVKAASGSNTSGYTMDYRTKSISQLSGTISYNGVDITSLFTDDINGTSRPSTPAGYAMGCSYDFNLWPGSSYVTESGGGTYHEATPSEVELSVTFGPNESYIGTYDPVSGNYTNPGVANVKKDTPYTFAGDDKTGTLESTDPGVGNVLSGIDYIIESDDKSGTGANIDFPTRTNVLTRDTVNNLAGLYTPCPETGPNGVDYGANATEFTLAVPADVPTQGTLTASVSGTTVTLTMAGIDATATSYIYKRDMQQSSWDDSSIATITGNGSASVEFSAGDWELKAVIESVGGSQVLGATDPISIHVQSSTKSIQYFDVVGVEAMPGTGKKKLVLETRNQPLNPQKPGD